MDQQYPQGKLLGNATSLSSQRDTWTLQMPRSIMATNFWAEAKDAGGQTIKSQDLGNVGYREAAGKTKAYTNTKYGFQIEIPADWT
jgi:hypothetical protein